MPLMEFCFDRKESVLEIWGVEQNQFTKYYEKLHQVLWGNFWFKTYKSTRPTFHFEIWTIQLVSSNFFDNAQTSCRNDIISMFYHYWGISLCSFQLLDGLQSERNEPLIVKSHLLLNKHIGLLINISLVLNTVIVHLKWFVIVHEARN